MRQRTACRKQRGVTAIGMVLVAFGVVVLALLGLKIAPAYIEYFKVKSAVTSIVVSGEVRSGSVADVKRAFNRRASVDDITVVGEEDLDISKEGGEITISFSYQKKVPLFRNVSLLFEFAGSSGK